MTDFIILIGALVVVLIVQWSAFATYTSQVVPRLVLERLALDEDVKGASKNLGTSVIGKIGLS